MNADLPRDRDDLAIESGACESPPAPRRRRVLLWIIPLFIIVLAVVSGGAWYANYDPPIARANAPEWMESAAPEQLAPLLKPEDHSRWLNFPGVINARDIGGYPTQDGRMTRWGVLFRSGRLRDLDEQGCREFRRLNIRTVIDLRNRLFVDTADYGGDAVCVQNAAEMMMFRFIPPRDKGENKAEATRKLIARNVNTIRNVFETLADEDKLPALYHCTSGQDRAGIVTYLLLELLGVDRRVIRAEYDLSGEVGRVSQYEGINAVFQDIDAAGDIHQYLFNMGVPYKTQRNVCRNLLTQ